MDKIIHSCSSHIEELLDFFLDETYELPLLEEVGDTETVCQKCQQMAVYKLSGSEVKGKWE